MASLMLSAVAQHPSVNVIQDERDNGDGVWIYLNPGWTSDDGLGAVHEDTITDAVRRHRKVMYCPALYVARLWWAYPDQVGLLPAG